MESFNNSTNLQPFDTFSDCSWSSDCEESMPDNSTEFWLEAMYSSDESEEDTISYCPPIRMETQVLWLHNGRITSRYLNCCEFGWMGDKPVGFFDTPFGDRLGYCWRHGRWNEIVLSLDTLRLVEFSMFRSQIPMLDDEKLISRIVDIPMKSRCYYNLFKSLMPYFHSTYSNYESIRTELHTVLERSWTGDLFSVVDRDEMVDLRQRFWAAFAVYFAGVDLTHYTSSVVKSARPTGLRAGKPGNRRGNRGNARNKKVCDARREDKEKQKGMRDGDREVKNERAIPQCRICKELGHKSFNCPVAPVCLNCKRTGHETHACRKPLRPDLQPEVPANEPRTVPEVPEPPANDCRTLALCGETLKVVEPPSPEVKGLCFRTRTQYFMSCSRDVEISDTGTWIQQKTGFSVSGFINDYKMGFPGMNIIDKCFGFFLFSLAKPFIAIENEVRTVTRIGGLVHAVDKNFLPYRKEDVRHDYVAVGDIKHKNPLYCRYAVRAMNIAAIDRIVSKVSSVLYRHELLDQVNIPKVQLMLGDAAPESAVSKELFFNLANSRIAPYLSDDSAKNSISISISKTPLINLSKKYVEENNLASGCSDEAICRTREALMDFRMHLKEEQVLRHLQKMVSLHPGRYEPGFLEEQGSFETDSSAALN